MHYTKKGMEIAKKKRYDIDEHKKPASSSVKHILHNSLLDRFPINVPTTGIHTLIR